MANFNGFDPLPDPDWPYSTCVRMWKQDPIVKQIGICTIRLPTKVRVSKGPRDDRIVIRGLKRVSPDARGDFLATGGEALDAVHTFAVVRMALSLYQRALQQRGEVAELPWAWNVRGNQEPINVYPHGLPDTPNAFYDPAEQMLSFGDFVPQCRGPPRERVYTCRSLDVVAHETGHAILDGLKPGWSSVEAHPETGALHESFGDLTAMFLLLTQLDVVQQLIADTKGDLFHPNFLALFAEQFGDGVTCGSERYLRNAANTRKMSDVGTEVHALSEVFTGAIYYILSDMFNANRRRSRVNDAETLQETAARLCGLLLNAIVDSPADGATFADIGWRMRAKAGDLASVVERRLAEREVWLDGREVRGLGATAGMQNRGGCCATMQHQITLHAAHSVVSATRRRHRARKWQCF